MRETLFLFCLIVVPLYCCSQSATGKETEHEKYNLFSPVPKDMIKEMQTDRPDVTESPYTVSPGHFQVETDLFKSQRSNDGHIISIVNNFNSGNYKLGLSGNSDIQLVIPTYVSHYLRQEHTKKLISRTGGFDDVTLRFKYNVWGNSGGRTAFGILPYVSFPTSSFANNGVQGGIKFPFALSIHKNLDIGTQVETDIVREEDKKYHLAYLYSITFDQSFSSLLAGFAESVVTYSPFAHHTVLYINGGVIFLISKNFNLDAGVYYGIEKESAKTFFTGCSFRL